MRARYLDPDHTMFELIDADGKQFVGPAEPANRHYRLITEGDRDDGVKPATIAGYAPPAVTPEDVDAELERRVMENLRNAERERLKPHADLLKQRIAAGEAPDLDSSAEWGDAKRR